MALCWAHQSDIWPRNAKCDTWLKLWNCTVMQLISHSSAYRATNDSLPVSLISIFPHEILIILEQHLSCGRLWNMARSKPSTLSITSRSFCLPSIS